MSFTNAIERVTSGVKITIILDRPSIQTEPLFHFKRFDRRGLLAG